ncbi:26.2 kDa heat shock protein mitochondrial [Phtheirospermum japonicum]|uniref:26.2 kDa heat shock protein mitochondrial n=1 Tax=Phtheirospermum japonicum TaxID=374723 RepID=A0A830BV27_9LAMI|nr:26.2 kDa heat shock protein mitochondrial [Phtheirospermum japonicum]
MAASLLTLKHLSRLLLSSSLRPVCPVTLRSASRCFSTNAEQSFYDQFDVEREPSPTSEDPDLPPFIHHEYKAQSQGDGFHIRLYMAGVSKGNVKVWIEHDELIAEGKREKDYEDEDDTNALIRYRMSRPPTEVFNLDAIKAEIKNGILKVFVPRKD